VASRGGGGRYDDPRGGDRDRATALQPPLSQIAASAPTMKTSARYPSE
jgi:hypothetical protein